MPLPTPRGMNSIWRQEYCHEGRISTRRMNKAMDTEDLSQRDELEAHYPNDAIWRHIIPTMRFGGTLSQRCDLEAHYPNDAIWRHIIPTPDELEEHYPNDSNWMNIFRALFLYINIAFFI
ncbi:unnamed protein product [Gordionus sp. m RMFG-2023]